jgi:hypothetical protein
MPPNVIQAEPIFDAAFVPAFVDGFPIFEMNGCSILVMKNPYLVLFCQHFQASEKFFFWLSPIWLFLAGNRIELLYRVVIFIWFAHQNPFPQLMFNARVPACAKGVLAIIANGFGHHGSNRNLISCQFPALMNFHFFLARFDGDEGGVSRSASAGCSSDQSLMMRPRYRRCPARKWASSRRGSFPKRSQSALRAVRTSARASSRFSFMACLPAVQGE